MGLIMVASIPPGLASGSKNKIGWESQANKTATQLLMASLVPVKFLVYRA